MAVCSYGQRLSFVFILLTGFYIIGIYLFTQGFLLNRLVVPQHSDCKDGLNNSSLFSHSDGEDTLSCWMAPRFKRAVIIVIDALRHDFMVYNESLTEKDAYSYQNKLKVVHEVLQTKPDHGNIFKFVADPPTTTMQRIKGLTTGSLPTFIDAGSNFASSEILEDNIISQLQSLGKKLVFMGDDTWMGLFPNSFQIYYPFPSFNVKDLHTVDNGVISHLIPEMKRNDWDVIIAHFLGVDHCGHRYGPYHSAMADKLSQMDLVLRSVINELDNGTVLFVFGDHGMTKTGDHGGDSTDEVYAGLFVYSSAKPFALDNVEDDLVVSQTDIVPTLALLLGAPIPFANLGIVITSLFSGAAKEPLSLQALQLNARQVHRYLTEYSKFSNDISSSALKNLTKLFLEAENHVSVLSRGINLDEDIKRLGNMSLIEQKYVTYLREVREACRSVWAKFDLTAIVAGIAVVSVSCVANILIIIAPKSLRNPKLTMYNTFGVLVGIVFVAFLLSFVVPWMATAFLLLLGDLYLILLFRKARLNFFKGIFTSSSFKEITIAFLLLSYFLSFFSNSFVVHEDKVVLFFLQTLLVVSTLDFLRNSGISSKYGDSENLRTKLKRRKDNKTRASGWVLFRDIKLKLLLLIALLTLTRVGQLFWVCREEQNQCEASVFLKPSTEQHAEREPGYPFWISILFICLIPVSLRLRLAFSGNLYCYSCTVLAAKYALPIGSFFACFHWLLQFVPAEMLNQTPAVGFLQQIITPCLVYLCSVLTLFCLLYKPLTIYQVESPDISDDPTLWTRHQPAAEAVVAIFKRLRSEMMEKNSGQRGRPPLVYGLGTVYSSAVSVFVVCFALPLALLQGVGLSSSVTLMLLQIFGFLELYSTLTLEETAGDESAGSFVYPVITWFLMSSHYFFSSGHQSTIPSIRFEAAFVGLPGDMGNFFIPGFLILLNTFASDVIFSISLPLITFWPKKRSSFVGMTAGASDRNKAEEFVYGENSERLRTDVFRLCALYQGCKAFKLLGTMSAAAVHRRHLMVWKIFAPRFVFEGVSFIVTSFLLVLVFWFVLRVDRALVGWQMKLQTAQHS